MVYNKDLSNTSGKGSKFYLFIGIVVLLVVIVVYLFASGGSDEEIIAEEQTEVSTDVVRGRVYVSTNPSGASVIINDVFIGSTPIEGYELEAGDYTILIEKEGCNTIARHYAITDEPLVINETLEYAEVVEEAVSEQFYSTIEVITSPSGADVLVNGIKVGVTPLSDFKLEEGSYSLEIVKRGYVTICEQVVVDDKPVIVIDKRLVAAQKAAVEESAEPETPASVNGRLNVTSTPVGATVSVDGNVIGSTPINGYEIKTGAHLVTISKDGYSAVTKQVFVGKQSANIDVNLVAKKPAKSGGASMNDKGAAAYAAGNYSEAFKCFEIAAQQGDSEAQNNLAVCYEFGKGVKKDLDKAYEWYSKAAANGNSGAKAALQKKKFKKYSN